MAAAPDHVATALVPGVDSARREEREETIRIIEYASFPRVAPQQQLRVGFTRDLSESGMCLGVDRRERVGSLLRLCVRDVDGHCADAVVGRVVWANSERDGRFWLGLSLITKALPWNVVKCREKNEAGEAAIHRLHA